MFTSPLCLRLIFCSRSDLGVISLHLCVPHLTSSRTLTSSRGYTYTSPHLFISAPLFLGMEFLTTTLEFSWASLQEAGYWVHTPPARLCTLTQALTLCLLHRRLSPALHLTSISGTPLAPLLHSPLTWRPSFAFWPPLHTSRVSHHLSAPLRSASFCTLGTLCLCASPHHCPSYL